MLTETTTSVHTATGSQFREDERRHVLVGAVHPLADPGAIPVSSPLKYHGRMLNVLGKVDENGLLVAFTHALGRRDLVRPCTTRCVIGVLLGEQSKKL